MDHQFDIILLAAQRTGVVNPLAEAHGVSHKCLIPVASKRIAGVQERGCTICHYHRG